MSRKSRTEIQFFTNKKLQAQQPPPSKIPITPRWGVEISFQHCYNQAYPKHLMIDENSAECRFLPFVRRM